ncbi:MAG: hypothetical protein HY076_07325 [Candidatus Eisenbacteria bacterium]|uniref:DUF222 domain-containing protein n=1 Tax=Eiseniibacteriota bacterium TaxID=2212470 RepID=A0A9D6QMS6_UNCEI|nr:hypothetical protein [Candidatus Eisenbacteria bacterium]MBI3540068.1 hypothetical protein [Candidatus Eisenbacteria bacterium]
MRNYSLRHLSDATLRRDLKEQSRKEAGLTAWVLAHIAEFHERRLYRGDGYPSMYAWCIGELGYCEQTAYKRISAARVALRFPVIFAMLAERYPRPDLVTVIQSLAPASSPTPVLDQLSSRRVDGNEARPALAPVEVTRPRITPLAPECFGLQVTIGQSTRDKLRHAQDLLGHQVPANDLPAVLDRALDALVVELGGRQT